MSEFETVHTIANYWDGPRDGIADFHGKPHVYESQFSDTDDDWTDIFRLSPISSELFDLALESWSIWLRWKASYERGETTHDTHPALPMDRLRRDELELILKSRLIVDKTNFVVDAVLQHRPFVVRQLDFNQRHTDILPRPWRRDLHAKREPGGAARALGARKLLLAQLLTRPYL